MARAGCGARRGGRPGRGGPDGARRTARSAAGASDHPAPPGARNRPDPVPPRGCGDALGALCHRLCQMDRVLPPRSPCGARRRTRSRSGSSASFGGSVSITSSCSANDTSARCWRSSPATTTSIDPTERSGCSPLARQRSPHAGQSEFGQYSAASTGCMSALPDGRRLYAPPQALPGVEVHDHVVNGRGPGPVTPCATPACGNRACTLRMREVWPRPRAPSGAHLDVEPLGRAAHPLGRG